MGIAVTTGHATERSAVVDAWSGAGQEVWTMTRSRRLRSIVATVAWTAAPALIALVSLGRRWEL